MHSSFIIKNSTNIKIRKVHIDRLGVYFKSAWLYVLAVFGQCLLDTDSAISSAKRTSFMLKKGIRPQIGKSTVAYMGILQCISRIMLFLY